MKQIIELLGGLLIPLALVHFDFPRRFGWKEELPRLSLLNKQVMEVHTFFIGLVVFLIGVLCLTSAELLVSTELGSRICWGLFVFWFARLVVQFAYYSPELWRGKRFEKAVYMALRQIGWMVSGH